MTLRKAIRSWQNAMPEDKAALWEEVIQMAHIENPDNWPQAVAMLADARGSDD